LRKTHARARGFGNKANPRPRKWLGFSSATRDWECFSLDVSAGRYSKRCSAATPARRHRTRAPGAHKCCTASGCARSVLLARCRNRNQASGTSCHATTQLRCRRWFASSNARAAPRLFHWSDGLRFSTRQLTCWLRAARLRELPRRTFRCCGVASYRRSQLPTAAFKEETRQRRYNKRALCQKRALERVAQPFWWGVTAHDT
jgi:hypothetical protein